MMFSFGASAKAETVLVTLVVLFGGDRVAGLQAGNFAGITINRHFRGDIFHNEGETSFYINCAKDVVLKLSSASHHRLIKRIFCGNSYPWLIFI